MSRSWVPARSLSNRSIMTSTTFIRNMPYSLLKNLADELDLLGTATNWKDFALRIPKSPQNLEPKYTVGDMRKFESEAARGASPTMAVIESWATTNATVQHLVDVLASLDLVSLVRMIELKIQKPPSYEEVTGHTSLSDLPSTAQSPIPNSVSQPVSTHDRPFTRRQPTEHDSLSSVHLQENNATAQSISKSTASLEGFSLDGNGSVSSYSYSSLRMVTSDFNSSLKLGEGAFGSVFKGQLSQIADGDNIKETRKIAIKRLKLDTPEFAASIAEQFKKEVHLISELKHENILPLMGYSCDGPELCLVYDYMFNGSLSSSLEASRKGSVVLNVGQRLEISRGSACGIAYLHEKKLIHRDIKSSNILLDSEMKPRISDFGLIRSTNTDLAGRTSTQTNNPIGTLVYMSPEASKGTLSFAMDVYSFGVVLLELLTGAAVIDEARSPTHLTYYVEEECDGKPVETFCDRAAGTWALGIAESLYTLTKKCLEFKRLKRPTMQNVCLELRSLCDKEAVSR